MSPSYLSRPALQDLAETLVTARQRKELLVSFRAALTNRLLTAAAATTDIVGHYVATVKALRELDPTGVLLDAVGGPDPGVSAKEEVSLLSF